MVYGLCIYNKNSKYCWIFILSISLGTWVIITTWDLLRRSWPIRPSDCGYRCLVDWGDRGIAKREHIKCFAIKFSFVCGIMSSSNVSVPFNIIQPFEMWLAAMYFFTRCFLIFLFQQSASSILHLRMFTKSCTTSGAQILITSKTLEHNIRKKWVLLEMMRAAGNHYW